MDEAMIDDLFSRIGKIEKRLEDLLMTSKEALTFEEAWKFLRISASQLYKLVGKQIPAFKPGGKLLYFKRRDFENWMLSNRKKTDKKLTAEALNKLERK